MLEAGAQSNGCENEPGSPVGYRTLFPLHAQYRGTQMDYALHYLAAHKHTRLVTIDIGANDVFLCQETTSDHCTAPAELNGVANEIATNLGTIFHELRDVAGYHGPIVALTYYSLSYSDPAIGRGHRVSRLGDRRRHDGQQWDRRGRVRRVRGAVARASAATRVLPDC